MMKALRKPQPFYRSRLIRQQMALQEITIERLSQITKEIDPTGTGVSTVSIGRMKKGRPQDMKKLRLVADALGIDWGELFNFAADKEAA